MKKRTVKHKENKLRLDLLPIEPLEALAEIYQGGIPEYGEDTWREGTSWKDIYAALMRHIFAWRKGIDKDEKSGKLHLSHAMWNITTLLYYQIKGIGEDDRK